MLEWQDGCASGIPCRGGCREENSMYIGGGAILLIILLIIFLR